MTALDLLHHLIDQVYAEGFAAGRNSVLGETHRADEGDGPAAGISWEAVARHCEANPTRLSAWEREMADRGRRALRRSPAGVRLGSGGRIGGGAPG